MRFEISNLKLPAVISGKSTSNLTAFMQNKANFKTEARKQNTEDKIGKPGNQDNMMQVIRITGNQDEGYQQTRESGYSPTFSTIVEDPLQIGPVLCKTKPIFEKVKWM